MGSGYQKCTLNLQICCNQSCSIMSSGYLQSTVNLQKCCNECCCIMGSGYLKATLTLQKCCNQCCSISWIVDTCNLQVTCKNVLIKARAVASLGGGGRGLGQLSPLDLLSQTNQFCGWICFPFIVVTCNCLPFSWPRSWLVHGVCK